MSFNQHASPFDPSYVKVSAINIDLKHLEIESFAFLNEFNGILYSPLHLGDNSERDRDLEYIPMLLSGLVGDFAPKLLL